MLKDLVGTFFNLPILCQIKGIGKYFDAIKSNIY